MRPKITIISPVFPYRGGIANFTEAFFTDLQEKADVSLINFKRQYPSLLFPGKTQFETNSKKNIFSERTIDSVNPFTWFSAGRKIKRDAPDFLVFAYWHPFFAPAYGTIAGIARKNKKTKIIALCHNVLPHERNFTDIPLAKMFFKKVDFAITLSQKSSNDLKLLNDKIKSKTLFHPVYSNFGEPAEKRAAREKLGLADKKTILFFGFIRKYKGLDILLRSIALLKNKIDFQLLVAGEFYEKKDEYLNLIKDYKLDDVVILRDKFIPSDEVKYYFGVADVVVLPYRSATQSGIVQIANNFHKPVIATDVGGLSEIIIDGVNGYIVEPENPQELADAILRFYQNNDEEKFSANVKFAVGKYSWGKFVSEFLDFIEGK